MTETSLKSKCAEQPLNKLIAGYTLVRMLKRPTTHELTAMVAVGDEIESREGESYLDNLMDEIDAIKYAKV